MEPQQTSPQPNPNNAGQTPDTSNGAMPEPVQSAVSQPGLMTPPAGQMPGADPQASTGQVPTMPSAGTMDTPPPQTDTRGVLDSMTASTTLPSSAVQGGKKSIFPLLALAVVLIAVVVYLFLR